MDFEAIAADLIRSLRGRRSQTAFSRRLGYRSNVVYRWESGRAWPTAATVLKAARRVGVDIRAGLRAFFPAEPPWLDQTDPATPEGVTILLNHLRGSTRIGDLAKASGYSRFTIARWLKGAAEPRFPEFLVMVEACSLRLLDWVSIFADPSQLPSVAQAWADLQAGRESAYTMPWSHAVLRALELEQYQALEKHEPGWIARRLGISLDEEQRCIELLSRTRQIRMQGLRWAVDPSRVIDTRPGRERSLKVKDWWTKVALERLKTGEGLVFSYNLFSISDHDLERVRDAYLSFYQQMRSIVSTSQPNEQVVLFTAQMVAIGPEPSRTETQTPHDQDR